jgi:PKD repeat protein
VLSRAVALAAIALVTAAPAAGAPGLAIGVADDEFKLEPQNAWLVAASLGLDAARITLAWTPGQTQLAPADAALVAGATAGAAGRRVVLAVYGTDDAAPQDEPAREAFCAYAADALAANALIDDVIVWNEPNKQAFWRPQFNADGSSAAPAAYAALLARCYDVLHAVRPSVNVIGLATAPRGLDNPGGAAVISHSVGSFVRKVGGWYRASGRTAPLFDTVAHHAYPATSAERPWKRHADVFVGEGDWDALMNALDDAFGGTGQPVPGQCVAGRCVEIWYTEAGYQTVVDATKAGLYTGTETDAQAIPDLAAGEPDAPPPDAASLAPDQATQLRDAIRLAACQDYVGALFGFLLNDEPDRSRWQSGLHWADRTPKDSLPAFVAAAAEAQANAVDCAALKGGPEPDAAFTAGPGAVPLGATLTDTSTGGVPTTWRWDVGTDGTVEATTPTATVTFPAPGVYPVALLVRNGVGEDRITRSVGVPALGAPGPCATETASVRRVEARYGAVSLPTGAVVSALRVSEALPAEVAARLAALLGLPELAADIAAATAATAAHDWAVAPDEQADTAAALAAAFAQAALGLPGTLVTGPEQSRPDDVIELGSAAVARLDGATDCRAARATVSLVRQDATLVPPPPVVTLVQAAVVRSGRGPAIAASVACGGYATQRCSGVVRLDHGRGARAARIGRAPFVVAGQGSAKVTVRLSYRALRTLTRLGVLRGVRVRIDAAEGTARRTARLAVRPLRPRTVDRSAQAGAPTAGSSASARSTSAAGYSKSGS